MTANNNSVNNNSNSDVINNESNRDNIVLDVNVQKNDQDKISVNRKTENNSLPNNSDDNQFGFTANKSSVRNAINFMGIYFVKNLFHVIIHLYLQY